MLLTLLFAALHNDAFVTLTSENQVPPLHMRSLAAQLNESKIMFLHNLRKQFLQGAPFTQDEDTDVERVVRRAVEHFTHEKEEIVLRIVNDYK